MLLGRRFTTRCITHRGLLKLVPGTLKPSLYSMPQSAADAPAAERTSPLPLFPVTQQSYCTNSGRSKAPTESSSHEQTSFPVTKVLFDGDCKLCTSEIHLLKRFSKDKPVEFVDITGTQYSPTDHQGITYEMAMKEMHVIGPDHKVYTRADAVRQMYTASGLNWLATLTRLPGIRPIADKLYLKFARHRLQRAIANCNSGSCSVKLHELKKKLDKSSSA